MQTVLLLAANPAATSRLRLDEEAREIHAGLERARKRDQFSLVTRWAVRPRDLMQALLETQPSIVHFSGHGSGHQGLSLQSDSCNEHLVTADALANVFSMCSDTISCVILNACHSEVQAVSISRHIDYVIGMSAAISDTSAIAFVVAFYDALGAGRSIEFSFEWGRNALSLTGLPGCEIPILTRRPGLEAAARNDVGIRSPKSKAIHPGAGVVPSPCVISIQLQRHDENVILTIEAPELSIHLGLDLAVGKTLQSLGRGLTLTAERLGQHVRLQVRRSAGELLGRVQMQVAVGSTLWGTREVAPSSSSFRNWKELGPSGDAVLLDELFDLSEASPF